MLELYPNLETVGINVQLGGLEDPQGDASARCMVALDDEVTLRAGHPMTYARSMRRFSGVVLWLRPDQRVSVQVTLTDPTTPALNVTLTGTVRTRAIDVQRGVTRSWYVAPDGSGTDFDSLRPGPLRTALDRVQAGEEVVLLGGQYRVGDLTFANDGTADAPITIRAARGQPAVFDGSDPDAVTFEQTSTPGLYVARVKPASANANLVTLNGTRLYPYGKLSDLVNHHLSCILATPQRIDLDGFWRDPRQSTVIPLNVVNPDYSKIWVKAVSNIDVSARKVEVSMQRSAFDMVDVRHVRFVDLIFRMYGVSPYGATIRAKDCSDLVIERCMFKHNDRPIMLDGSTDRTTIQDCSIADDVTWDTYIGKATYEPVTPALCHGITVPDLYPNNDRLLETGGVVFTHGFTGRGTVIRRCWFTGMMDGLKGVPPAVADSLTREIDIMDCVIDGADDAIELDGNAANVRFLRNRVTNTRGGISMAPPLVGPLYVIGNVVHDLQTGHATIEGQPELVTFHGQPFKLNVGDTTRAGSVYFYHNTCVAGGDGAGYGFNLYIPARIEAFTSRNNVFVCDTQDVYRITISRLSWSPRLDLDVNAFHQRNTSRMGEVNVGGQISILDDLKDLRSSFGHERGSLQTDPLFVDVAARNLRLLPSSPLIDAGEVIPGVNDRLYQGMAPDIGAYEWVATSTTDDMQARTSATVAIRDGRLIIHGTMIDGTARIYDLLGRQLATVEVTNGVGQMPISVSGMVIVTMSRHMYLCRVR